MILYWSSVHMFEMSVRNRGNRHTEKTYLYRFRCGGEKKKQNKMNCKLLH